MTEPRIDKSPVFEAAWTKSDQRLRSFLDSLVEAFAAYVQRGDHDHFGRDEPLDWPSSARAAALKHIHIIPVDPDLNPRFFKSWKLKRPFQRTSDRMLIYVKDDKGNYCLLAYLHDDAHTLLNKASLVGHLADLAEDWFRQNESFPVN